MDVAARRVGGAVRCKAVQGEDGQTPRLAASSSSCMQRAALVLQAWLGDCFQERQPSGGSGNAGPLSV